MRYEDFRESKTYKENTEYREAFEKLEEVRNRVYGKTQVDKKMQNKSEMSPKSKIILTIVLTLIVIGSFTASYFYTVSDVEKNPSFYVPETIKIMTE